MKQLFSTERLFVQTIWAEREKEQSEKPEEIRCTFLSFEEKEKREKEKPREQKVTKSAL